MPQQLIYTSAQRGIVAGRSGYCTVARSALMREALMLQLEKLSYYQHLSLTGGQERRISACRIFEIRGTRYHVLSRIQDAGLDFTGRTNFIAHHLVFTPEEIRQFASPPVILAKWSGWQTTWTKDPANLENEDWGNLSGLASVASVPAQTWQNLSGEAANGYGMLEIRVGSSFRVDNISEEQILALFAESLELLELRDPRRDHCVTAWQYTFTTSMQEQDNPADFKWRCIHADNPASTRFTGPDCRNLTDVKVIRVTNEEKSFAQLGRQAPRITVQPHDLHLKEGEAALLAVRAEGVPTPRYQWYAVDKSGAGQIIPDATGPELNLQNPPFGVSRYVVQVVNTVGEVTSEVAKVECEKKIRLATPAAQSVAPSQPADLGYDPDYEARRDNQRMRYQQEEANRENKSRRIWSRIVTILGLVVLAVLIATGVVVWRKGRMEGLPQAQLISKASPTEAELQNGGIVAPTTNPPQQGAHKTMSKPEEQSKPISSQGVIAFDEVPLTGGWSKIEIGKVESTHVYQLKGLNYFQIITSSGNFKDAQDNVVFVYKTNQDKSFNAKISLDATNGVSGIMMRESLVNDAKFLFIGATHQKVYVYKRGGKGVETTSVDYTNIHENINLEIRLNEKDGKWEAGYSTDFVKIVPVKKSEVHLGTNTVVGFTQAYGVSNSPANAKFQQLPSR